MLLAQVLLMTWSPRTSLFRGRKRGHQEVSASGTTSSFVLGKAAKSYGEIRYVKANRIRTPFLSYIPCLP